MLSRPFGRTGGAWKVALTGFVIGAMLCPHIAWAGPTDPFTIALMGDTQKYSTSMAATYWPNRYTDVTGWIANNIATENIAFVTSVGDITQATSASLSAEWNRAMAAFNKFHVGDNPSNAVLVPYSIAPGNHDYDNKRWLGADGWVPGTKNMYYGTSFWQSYLSPTSSRYAGKSWYGSDLGWTHSYANTNSSLPDIVYTGVGENTYQTFQAGGETYMHITLSCGAPDGDLAWAQSIINANPGVKTMVTTHSFSTGGSPGAFTDRIAGGRYFTQYNSALPMPQRYQIPGNGGVDIWNEFIKTNDQIFMVFCGHTGGRSTRIEQNASGKDVIIMLFDPITRRLSTDGDGSNTYINGAGWVRLLEFDPVSGNIHSQTYSTVLDEWSDNVGGDLLGDPTLHPDAYNPDCYDAGGNLTNPNGLSDFIITPAGQIVPVPEPASISLLALGACLALLRKPTYRRWAGRRR